MTLYNNRIFPSGFNYDNISIIAQASRVHPSMNRLHGKKIGCLVGCLGQVDRVPWEGGLPCLACKCSISFYKETYEKLALPG